MTTIRVAIVDDDPIVRNAVSDYLARPDDIDVVAVGNDGSEAARIAVEYDVDVMILDIRMPGLDGISAITEVLTAKPSTKIMLLTSIDGVDEVRRGLDAGARGYLVKDSSPTTIIEAVRTVMTGASVVTPSTLQRLMNADRPKRLVSTGNGTPLADPLSPREDEVLQYLVQGLSNAEIADTIYLSESTVKTYVSGIMTKLGASSRLKAVVRAYELGLVGDSAEA